MVPLKALLVTVTMVLIPPIVMLTLALSLTSEVVPAKATAVRSVSLESITLSVDTVTAVSIGVELSIVKVLEEALDKLPLASVVYTL